MLDAGYSMINYGQIALKKISRTGYLGFSIKKLSRLKDTVLFPLDI